jgi:hypothetical protein
MVQAILGKKLRPYLQNNWNKKGWRGVSSSTAPASQAQSPDFKPQYRGKNKKAFLFSIYHIKQAKI